MAKQEDIRITAKVNLDSDLDFYALVGNLIEDLENNYMPEPGTRYYMAELRKKLENIDVEVNNG